MRQGLWLYSLAEDLHAMGVGGGFDWLHGYEHGTSIIHTEQDF